MFSLDFKNDGDCVTLYIKDISEIVNLQRDTSDRLYQDAIELNYSHE